MSVPGWFSVAVLRRKKHSPVFAPDFAPDFAPTVVPTFVLPVVSCCILSVVVLPYATAEDADHISLIDIESQETLRIPPLSSGAPAAGRRVKVTPVEYEGTQVFHTLYLPKDWSRSGPRFPVIFEYTGNYFPQSGSTGEPEDGALGYCLSAGQYIWVSLPYISVDGRDNAVTWWGDAAATVAYAKLHVPQIISEFHADPDRVILCGFSRGAIGVNYIGLHDDEIAGLWSAFVSHDHFDGVRQWGRTTWGAPLEKYRKEAAKRLKRVNGRPYLVSQNGGRYGSKEFIHSVLSDTDNFTFSTIRAAEIFGQFPNATAKTGHTDRWAVLPSKYRKATWQWMNAVMAGRP